MYCVLFQHYQQYLHEIYILFDSRELVQSLFSELVSTRYQIKETVDGSTLYSAVHFVMNPLTGTSVLIGEILFKFESEEKFIEPGAGDSREIYDMKRGEKINR